jgi:hypothetical protein
MMAWSDPGACFTRRYRGGVNELTRFARICRVSRVMQPYLDSIA